MSQINLHVLDLNLLVVLDVLLEERHVTRTARRLGRTQSAISHALGRLRDQLEDPLLVRMGGAMVPTPYADALAPEVRRILETLRRVLAHDARWDPETSERVFRLVAPDFVAAAFPALLAELDTLAPGVRVELSGPTPGMYQDVLAGRHDLVVAPPPGQPPEGICTRVMAQMPWVVFARQGHPFAHRWDLEAWLSCRHIQVRTAGTGPGPVDQALEALGHTRRHGPILPHFLLVPGLLRKSDMVFAAPRGVLAEISTEFGLLELPCPIALQPMEVAMSWSAQLDRDPAQVWFRAQVESALRATFAP